MRLKKRSKASRPFRALEQLEARTLLSVTIAAGGKSATYTDYDGDLVTVKITAGTLTGANFNTVANGLGEYMEYIDFSLGGFDGTNLSVTAVKSATGDGLADVGTLFSTNHDLGTVTIAGDLGAIFAGDATLATPGVKSLSVRSMGRNGLDNQDGSAFLPLSSSISGALTSLTVKGDMINVAFFAISVGTASISGSLVVRVSQHPPTWEL